jgi:Spy/CpxP family protein refolding chaperone
MGTERNRHPGVVISLAIMLVLSSGLVVAQERRNASNQNQRQGWWEKELVQNKLGLSSQQISAIAKLEEQNQEAARAQRRAQQQAYRGMIKLLTDGSPTEAEIAESRAALEETWVDSVRQGVDHWVKLRDELSSEQWEKLPKVAPRVLQLGGFRTRAMGSIRVGEKSD